MTQSGESTSMNADAMLGMADGLSGLVDSIVQRHVAGLETRIANLESQLRERSVSALPRKAATQKTVPIDVALSPNIRFDVTSAQKKPSAANDGQHDVIDAPLEAEQEQLLPTFHLAVVHFTLNPDYPVRRRVAWFCLAFALLLTQVICLTGVWVHTHAPPCRAVGDCDEGWFCNREFEIMSGGVVLPGRCVSCSSTSCNFSAASVSGTSNATFFCSTSPENELCQQCYNQEVFGDVWDQTDSSTQSLRRLRLMRASDWLAYVLAAVVVSLDVVKEACDIMACKLVQRSRSNRPMTNLSVSILTMMRHLVSIEVVLNVNCIVIFMGSTALEIFFNTLALMFIMQIDETIFDTFLRNGVCMEMESSPILCIDRDLTQRYMTRTKSAFVVVYPLIMLGHVVHFYLSQGATNGFVVIVTLFLPLLVQARIDLQNPNTCTRNLCKDWLLPCMHGFAAGFAIYCLFGVLL